MANLKKVPNTIDQEQCSFLLSLNDITPLGITRGSNMLVKISGGPSYDVALMSKKTFNCLCIMHANSNGCGSMQALVVPCEQSEVYETPIHKVLTFQF